MIKNCHKIVVSDALISDNVLELLKYRDDDNKLFITNNFKKFQDVKAINLKNENDFLGKLKERINLNEPFLCASDSCEVVTRFYNECLVGATDKDKFLLITAKTKVFVKDANKCFKDKFVFYSPSITYGVDYSSDVPQDVFIFSKGQSIT